MHTSPIIRIPEYTFKYVGNQQKWDTFVKERSGGNEYIMDMTVTVIILPEAGWESYDWAGPVFNEEGNTAQVKMTSSLTVVATMKRTDTK